MNVNNYVATEVKPEDMLNDIFKKQHTLAMKYLDIEEKNGLLQTGAIPVDINDPKGQSRIKDMFWRCTEELMEALEAFTKEEEVHFYEEIADAMHFLVEAFILADMYPSYGKPGGDGLKAIFNLKLPPNYSPPLSFQDISPTAIDLQIVEFIQMMGLAANCLKNKPWKLTHMLTDLHRFTLYMNHAFRSFMILCKLVGFNAEGLYNMYIRKYQVNQFRQESDY